MGRQINFFLSSKDEIEFDEFLKKFEDICFLAYYNETNKPTIIENTIIRNSLKNGRRIYVVRKQDIDKVKFEYIENFNYWLIEDHSSPILHYDICLTFDNHIQSGRLYFEPKYVENLNWVEKDFDFVKWSDYIISKTRRFLKKHRYKYENSKYEYMVYCGEDALKLITNENVKISGDKIIISEKTPNP